VPREQRPSGPWFLRESRDPGGDSAYGPSMSTEPGWMDEQREAPDYLETDRGESATMPACC